MVLVAAHWPRRIAEESGAMVQSETREARSHLSRQKKGKRSNRRNIGMAVSKMRTTSRTLAKFNAWSRLLVLLFVLWVHLHGLGSAEPNLVSDVHARWVHWNLVQRIEAKAENVAVHPVTHLRQAHKNAKDEEYPSSNGEEDAERQCQARPAWSK